MQVIDHLVPYVVLWTYKLVAILCYPFGYTSDFGAVMAATSMDELPRLKNIQDVYVFEKQPSFITEFIGLIVFAAFIAAWLDARLFTSLKNGQNHW